MKIDDDCAKAFLNGKSFCRGNTLVSTGIMTLFGNMIAIKTNNVIKLNHCGWMTKTTKNRLNAILTLLNLPLIKQVKGVWYWKNDQVFKSGWNYINDDNDNNNEKD